MGFFWRFMGLLGFFEIYGIFLRFFLRFMGFVRFFKIYKIFLDFFEVYEIFYGIFFGNYGIFGIYGIYGILGIYEICLRFFQKVYEIFLSDLPLDTAEIVKTKNQKEI